MAWLLPADGIDSATRPEHSMSQKTHSPVSTPVPGRPPIPVPVVPQAPPVEPAEVLGRHKNDGQKDHKGAR
jgi:hypothetical protein